MSTLTTADNVATAPNVPNVPNLPVHTLVNPPIVNENKAARRSKKRGRLVTQSRDGQISTPSHPSTERFQMSDTLTADLVAPVAPIAIQKKEKVSAPLAEANQKPLHPRYVMQSDDLEEVEEQVIEALRLACTAKTNPELRAEINAWDAIRTYVNYYRDGEYDYEEAVSSVGSEKAPELFAAVSTIAGLYPIFDRHSNGHLRKADFKQETLETTGEDATFGSEPGTSAAKDAFILNEKTKPKKDKAVKAKKNRLKTKMAQNLTAPQPLKNAIMCQNEWDLTEAEDMTLEALRDWQRANHDPDYHAQLWALELVKLGLDAALRGGKDWTDAIEDMSLTSGEAAAFETVLGFWTRKTKDEKRKTKATPMAKQETTKRKGGKTFTQAEADASAADTRRQDPDLAFANNRGKTWFVYLPGEWQGRPAKGSKDALRMINEDNATRRA